MSDKTQKWVKETFAQALNPFTLYTLGETLMQ